MNKEACTWPLVTLELPESQVSDQQHSRRLSLDTFHSPNSNMSVFFLVYWPFPLIQTSLHFNAALCFDLVSLAMSSCEGCCTAGFDFSDFSFPFIEITFSLTLPLFYSLHLLLSFVRWAIHVFSISLSLQALCWSLLAPELPTQSQASMTL